MAHQKVNQRVKPDIAALAASSAISAGMLLMGFLALDHFGHQKIITGLFWPLARLMLLIAAGLAAGRIIEASGWTRFLAMAAGPFFRFANLGPRCSAAFTTAFVSGVAANAMLIDFYKDQKIDRRQLYLSNLINQLPAYFLHLPTTVFIVLPLTGLAGALYFLLTLLAALLRTALFLIYGHFKSPAKAEEHEGRHTLPAEGKLKSPKHLWQDIRNKLPGRVMGIAVYVVPIYILVFLLNNMGLFELARNWMANYVVTSFIPMESLSVVILSFAAEFTSGFAAAGALLDAGIITVKQTVIALLAGNIVAFPLRALRHQLPRYIGIFSPKMGTQLLLMGQGFRVLSLVLVGLVYYWIG